MIHPMPALAILVAVIPTTLEATAIAEEVAEMVVTSEVSDWASNPSLERP